MTEETLSVASIEIKDALPDDLEDIVNLLRVTWLDTYPNEEFGITVQDIEQVFDYSTPEARERLERRRKGINTNSNEHDWVAKQGEQIVGWCFAKKSDTNHLQTLYVLPTHQSQGIGARLLDTSLDWIGLDKDTTLNVVSFNQRAIDFYKRHEFVETGKPAKNDLPPLPSGAVIPEIEMIRTRNLN